MAIEIVDFPIKKWVDLSIAFCKRSPEGNHFSNQHISGFSHLLLESRVSDWWSVGPRKQQPYDLRHPYAKERVDLLIFNTWHIYMTYSNSKKSSIMEELLKP